MQIQRVVALVALAGLALGAPATWADDKRCSKTEQQINAQLEAATHVKLADHIKQHFMPNGSYLVSDPIYQKFVKGKRRLGRPSGGNSFLFVAGGAAVDKALAAAKKGAGYDFSMIESKLGLPHGTYPATDGLWRVDINVQTSCARLPRRSDPGANPQFVPGGFTSGGIPELLLINAPAKFIKQLVRPATAHAPKGSTAAKSAAAQRRANK